MMVAALLLITVVVVSLAACSSKSAGGAAQDNAAATSAPAAPMDPSADYDPDYAAEAQAVTEDSADSAAGTTWNVAQSGRKITFSAYYTIETKRFDEDYGRIASLVKNSDGYIATEETDTHSYYSGSQGRSSYLSLRIPIGKYDTFLKDIEGVGETVNRSKSSQDLTSQYFDTEARIELLKMRKERLIKYIEEATEPDVIIEFERELTDVLYDLDSYEGSKRGLDQLVDFATIDVSLNEVITAETIGKDGQPLGERAQSAFSLSMIGVGDFLKGVAVFLAGAAPVIVLLLITLIIIWLIFKLVRRIRRSIKKKDQIL
ncbi:hypothetical protein AGMMS49983_09060 [Clostridia bacterium]|nr:hypothetical protein AGMMS49983_09060 [Clostridia bacterium]